MILSTWQEWEVGKTYNHSVNIGVVFHDPQPVHVLRKATREEFIQYWVKLQGFPPIPKPGYSYYYEVSVD